METPAQAVAAQHDVKLRRTRPRITSLKIERSVIAERVKRFYDRDQQDRTAEIDARLQRYAKYRMWTEGRDWPWEDATDSAIPDMMTASMRLQDTLHNAVMSQRPPVMAKATKSVDREKEKTVDHLQDYQFFVEQPGEEIIGVLAHDFVNEGFFTAYVPWVKEFRHVVDVFTLPAIPETELPADYFKAFIDGKYPQAICVPTADGWDFTITPREEQGKKKPKIHKASFFTADGGGIEVEIEYEAIRYDGPRVMPKDLQDVMHPIRCDNLQIPGPSNPTGAAHVLLRDFPTIDEIKRLTASGYYDLMTEEDAKQLGFATLDFQYQQREEQKDIMAGQTPQKPPDGKEVKSHEKLTRLMCFDCFDIDGDGKDEDVIFWVILETKTVLKAKYLTEMFPANPPMRPLAEGHLFPVPGRRFSIGVLEMMEGMHDLLKQHFDQGADAGTLANAPFGFYRATSNMRPEVIRMWPGELYPLSDPKNDVHFPTMGNQSQAFTFNMVGLLTQMEEKLTNIGELQLGRVPSGKSSALRTVAGMQTVLSQGDARPERVLRRFFIGLTQIWRIMHSLNQVFLPKRKQILISGVKEPVNDPYLMVDGVDKVAGQFMFDFSANALNTSKEATQSAIQNLIGVYVSQLAIQLGVVKPEGVYRLFRDLGRSMGQDPDKYLSPPTQEAMLPPIMFEEAIDMIMQGQMPEGPPAEGAAAHLAKLQKFMNEDQTTMQHEHFGEIEFDAFALMSPNVLPLFKAYMEKVAKTAFGDQQQAKLLDAAKQLQAGAAPDGMPGPQAAPQRAPGPTQLQGGNELADESLPGAGGGANAAVMA